MNTKEHFQYTVSPDQLADICKAIEKKDFLPRIEDDKKIDYRCGKQQRSQSMSFKAGDRIRALGSKYVKVITVWKKTGLIDANPAATDDLVDVLANLYKNTDD